MDLNLKTVFPYAFMIIQRIERAVCGTDELDIHFPHYIADAELRRPEHFTASIINFFCGVGIQQLVDTEGIFQFHVGPVIKRIPQTIRYGLGPPGELFVIATAAGDIFFRHAVGPHRSPLVVVAVKPYLCEIIEIMVACNQLGRKMAVIIVNRHLFRVLVIQNFGGFSLEQEIFSKEFSHLTLAVVMLNSRLLIFIILIRPLVGWFFELCHLLGPVGYLAFRFLKPLRALFGLFFLFLLDFSYPDCIGYPSYCNGWYSNQHKNFIRHGIFSWILS